MIHHRFRPRRWGSHGSAPLLLLALALTACGDDESIAPGMRVPDLGLYAYDAIIQIGDSAADTLSGTISLTAASEDSIVGVWSVPGYAATPQHGPWNVSAYALPAQPTGADAQARFVTHRVWRRNASDDMECQVAYRHVIQEADTFSSSTIQNRCSLFRDGP